MNRFYTFLISTILFLCVGISNSYAQDLLVPQPYSIELEDSAEMGIPEAQYKMGKHYYQKFDSSYSKDQDKPYKEKASLLFYNAAMQGHMGAMYGLSKTYSNGMLVENDSVYYWLKRAADAGYADALFDLYKIYERGKSFVSTTIKKDKKKAEGYLKQALDKGTTEVYRSYIRHTHDIEEQNKYIQLLAGKGDIGGRMTLAKAYYWGRGKSIPKNQQKVWEICKSLLKDYEDESKCIKPGFIKDNIVYDYLSKYYFSIGDSVKAIECLGKDVVAYNNGGNAILLHRLANIKKNPAAQYWESAKYCREPDIFGLGSTRYGSDIKKCETNLLESASQGYAPAMGKLAYCFLELDGGLGLGGPWKAYEWALKGAEKDDPWAQYVLGICYLYAYNNQTGYGRGATKDEIELALKYLSKAAESGVAKAQAKLADLYLKGDKVQKDLNKAISLYEKATHENDINVLVSLGKLYEEQGNYIKSYQNFLRAANQKDPYATFRLALHYAYSYNSQYDGGTSRADSLRNTQKGLRLLHKADSLGNANAPWYIGLFHQLGFGVNKDIGKAIEYYKKAAEKGVSFASRDLAVIYYEGKLVEKNNNLAFKYAKEAAENLKWGPMTSSMRLLSACYRAGLGTKRDDAKAKYWLEQAAKNKDTDAIEILNVKVK